MKLSEEQPGYTDAVGAACTVAVFVTVVVEDVVTTVDVENVVVVLPVIVVDARTGVARTVVKWV